MVQAVQDVQLVHVVQLCHVSLYSRLRDIKHYLKCICSMSSSMKIKCSVEGVTHSKGPQATSQTPVCCSEYKASVHGTLALPTELNGVPHNAQKQTGCTLNMITDRLVQRCLDKLFLQGKQHHNFIFYFQMHPQTGMFTHVLRAFHLWLDHPVCKLIPNVSRF